MNKLILVIVAFGMVGCKVEEGSSSSNQDGISSFSGGCIPRSYEELSLYGWGCSSGGNSSSSVSDGTTVETSHPANITRYEEYEPNNIAENANLLAFPFVSGDTVPGIEVTGSVLDVSDESDYFILSPNRGGNYAIYLCEDACTEHPTDSMVAIRVIDQFGAEIAGNPLYTESTKIITAQLDAGVPYYVQILAFDTRGQEYPYRLVIID